MKSKKTRKKSATEKEAQRLKRIHVQLMQGLRVAKMARITAAVMSSPEHSIMFV